MSQLYKELFQNQFPLAFDYDGVCADLRTLNWMVCCEQLPEYTLETRTAQLVDTGL